LSQPDQARILVVDDDEGIRKTVSLILRHAGYVVDVAENGGEAVKRSNQNFYNLAIIDIRLPDMEGTDLLTVLHKTTPRMVKIILTGYPSVANAAKAVNRKADYYLIKPVDNRELLRVIKECLDNQRGEREYGREKIAEFITTRLNELQAEELRQSS
jgi:DNA-binding NtrC family response regulator